MPLCAQARHRQFGGSVLALGGRWKHGRWGAGRGGTQERELAIEPLGAVAITTAGRGDLVKLPEELSPRESQTVEGPRANQILHHRPGEPGAGAEVSQRVESAFILAGIEDGLEPGPAQAADLCQTDADSSVFDPITIATPVDVHGTNLDAAVLCFVEDYLRGIEPHRLVGHDGGQELGRIVGLEVGGLVGDDGERSGVGLTEPVGGEGG